MSDAPKTDAPALTPHTGGVADAGRIENAFLKFPNDAAKVDSRGVSGYDAGEATMKALRQEYTDYLQGPMEANQPRAKWATDRLQVDDRGTGTPDDPGYGPVALDAAAGAWLYDNGIANFGAITRSTIEDLRTSSSDPVETALNNLMADQVEREPLFWKTGLGPDASPEVSLTSTDTVLGYTEGVRSPTKPPQESGGIWGWISKEL